MIKANELRVGNWFSHNSEWSYRNKEGYFQWDSTDWYALGECTIYLENIEPIPLTPEILEKLGFDLISTDMLGGWLTYQKGGLEIQIGFGGVHFKHSSKTTTVLQYVHEIQNLYFALTGNELEINDL